MGKLLLKNAKIINENNIFESDILLHDEIILKIDRNINAPEVEVIDIKGNYVFPGVIDDQVHFREPGLTHKGTIASESRAALAGGDYYLYGTTQY